MLICKSVLLRSSHVDRRVDVRVADGEEAGAGVEGEVGWQIVFDADAVGDAVSFSVDLAQGVERTASRVLGDLDRARVVAYDARDVSAVGGEGVFEEIGELTAVIGAGQICPCRRPLAEEHGRI